MSDASHGLYDDDEDWEDLCRRADEYDEHPEPAEHAVTVAIKAGANEAPAATLPQEFWDARPWLKTVRQAAHSHMYSGDATLGCVLARIASMASPNLQFNFGLGEGSLNLGVALFGGRWFGNSTSIRISGKLVRMPAHLRDPELYRDGIGIGTGEGMCEAYMGYVDQAEDTMQGQQRRPKVNRVKAQVRNNVFFYVDEAVTILKHMTRKDATLGPVLRSAFFGETLGQANASVETTRYLPSMSYSMGVVVGFQQEPAIEMMRDAGVGTPQRFIWIGVADPNMPPVDQELEWPGYLDIPLADEGGTPYTGTIGCPPELRLKLRNDQRERNMGNVAVEQLDAHLPYIRCKLAAIFAIMDGRMKADWDDWKLAGMIMDASTATRDRIVEFAQHHEEDQAERKIEQAVQSAVRTKLAVEQVDAKVEKYAARIAERVLDGSIQTRRQVANNVFAKKTRHWMEPSVDYAVQRGWITEDDGVLKPGDSRPAL
jgi:hypothetical protein